MAIVRWNPLLPSLNRWPSIWDDEDMDFMSNMASNNLDVYETDDEVVVKANVAGVPAEKIDVTFEKGVLYVTAQAEEQSDDTQKKHYSKSSWKYSYRVAVPGILDYNQEPTAEVDNGVLILTFKKAEQSKPKKLQVKTGSTNK
jgi:HSP20 family protein